MAEARQIAIVLYPGPTALDAIGPYEVLKLLPDTEYDPHPPFDAGHPSKVSEGVRMKTAEALARDSRNPQDFISVPKILWRLAIDSARQTTRRSS